eukprot:2912016-Rhodomonas_salina.2
MGTHRVSLPSTPVAAGLSVEVLRNSKAFQTVRNSGPLCHVPCRKEKHQKRRTEGAKCFCAHAPGHDVIVSTATMGYGQMRRRVREMWPWVIAGIR